MEEELLGVAREVRGRRACGSDERWTGVGYGHFGSRSRSRHRGAQFVNRVPRWTWRNGVGGGRKAMGG